MVEKELYKLKKSKTVRLSDSTVKNINYMVNETKISESELLRSIIEKAIAEYRLKNALNLIKIKNITTSEGAKIAGLSYREFYAKVVGSGILSEDDGSSITNKDKSEYKKHLEDLFRIIDNPTSINKKKKINYENYHIGGGLDKVHKSIKSKKNK